METTSISSLASLNNIRSHNQNQSPSDEAMPSFKGDFSSFRSADIRALSPSNVRAETDTLSVEAAEQASIVGLVEKANQAFRAQGTTLMFELDKDSNRPILLIKDSQTAEVIRQVPSDSYLDMSKKITDYLEGISATTMQNNTASPLGLLASEVA
ncbi:flagellar protein FlaG [Thiomicrospira microaerophila]|uniref:flagellar protein FlaG n=1 Tax=Thiomicrospira microaerophila TaxID=406020 RepID=UPI0005CB1349|nr:flagellar protein FlaG [Thiomicrospira microaerophila]